LIDRLIGVYAKFPAAHVYGVYISLRRFDIPAVPIRNSLIEVCW